MALFQKIVGNKTEVPRFDDPEKRPEIGDMQRYSLKLAATRAVIRQFRKELKVFGRYEGSKLQLMDQFSVKRSELSEWPIYLLVWSAGKPHKAEGKRANVTRSSSVAKTQPSRKRSFEKGDESPTVVREKRSTAQTPLQPVSR